VFEVVLMPLRRLLPALHADISMTLFAAGKALLGPLRIIFSLRPMPLKVLVRLAWADHDPKP